MKVSRQAWKSLISKLSAISKKAADEMEKYMALHPSADMPEIVMVANALATKYGEAAATLSCDMYDAVAEVSGVVVPSAEPAPTATYGEVAKAVYGTAKTSPASIPQVVGRLVKTAGADTTLRNAQRDGAQFAWIPSGDTCAFCIALASRGWQYMSKNTLKNGHAEHIHSNCDCEYAVRFSENDGVSGYDPRVYEDIYYGAEGNTPQERINFMRRQHYAANKDKINEQKRAAYANKKLITGGRILDPNGDYERKWASQYYEEIRHKSTDCRKIADRIGVDEKNINAIKNYLFFEGKWYNPITERDEQFVPDAAIAQSWQRLAESKIIKHHDLTLINHELFEMQIKKENPGISHDEAHTQATMRYNYQKESDDYYANLRKNKKR